MHNYLGPANFVFPYYIASNILYFLSSDLLVKSFNIHTLTRFVNKTYEFNYKHENLIYPKDINNKVN